jgi:hypothetical protein
MSEFYVAWRYQVAKNGNEVLDKDLISNPRSIAYKLDEHYAKKLTSRYRGVFIEIADNEAKALIAARHALAEGATRILVSAALPSPFDLEILK